MGHLRLEKMYFVMTVLLGCAAKIAISNTLRSSSLRNNELDQTSTLQRQELSQMDTHMSLLREIKHRLNYTHYVNSLSSGQRQEVMGRFMSSGLLGKPLLTSIFDMLEKNVEQTLANLSVSAECMEDLTTTFTALMAGEMWALRIVDAAGKLGSGFLEGNMYWFGSYDECLKTTPTGIDQNNQTIVLFKTHYILTTLPIIPSSPFPLKWGSCLPATCTADDVSSTVKEVLAPLQISTRGVKSSVKEETFPLDAGAIGMISALSVLLIFLVIGTAYDVLIYQPMVEQEKEQSEKDDSGNVSGSGSSSSSPEEAAKGILAADEYTPLVPSKRTKAPVNSNDINVVAKVLLKLSLYSNAKKLLHTGQTSGSVLGSVHGIRFISMTWVILGHTYFFGVSNIRNVTIFQDFIKGIEFQAIINATVSVDTFFLLSGLLVSYLLMREMKEKGGPRKINWVLFYFHRFWRLTPPYMLLLGAYTTLFKYFGNGPAWPGDVPEPNCRTNWWTNLLYINNLVKPSTGCMMWTWYLANDMQFYIISPIVLIPLYLHFGAGLAVTLGLMLISLVTSGVISTQKHYPPSTAAMLNYLNKLFDYFDHFYMVPWTRIGPYLIGILIGYALYRTNRKVKLQWYTVTIGWLLAVGTNLAILYGLYDVANGAPITNGVSAFYNTVHRTLWACGVGWVIFACVTGYGGPVNRLLSWPVLIPLSRLTYMAYLIHPIVMNWFYLSRKTPIYLDVSAVIYLFFGHLVMSYGLSFVLSLAFEAPMIALEKFVFKRN